jgi:hypothetical protein
MRWSERRDETDRQRRTTTAEVGVMGWVSPAGGLSGRGRGLAWRRRRREQYDDDMCLNGEKDTL